MKMEILLENFRRYEGQVLKEQKEDTPNAAPQFSSAAAGAAIAQAYVGGPRDVRAFLDSPQGKDPKVRQILSHPEVAADGAVDDDNISISTSAAKPVKDLVPTQKFIDLMQSVSFPLGSAKILSKNINAKKGFGPITTSDDLIIDGHHRWSGIFAVAPDATISATNIGFPGNAKQKLAAAQLAIGSIDPNLNDPHPSKGGKPSANILGKGKDEIYRLILKHVGVKPTDPKAPGPILNPTMINTIISTPMNDILDWAAVPQGARKDPNKVIKYIAVRVAKNLAAMNTFVSGAPDRPDMPQFDDPSIGGAKGKNKIYSKLATNRLNVVPPFTKK